MMNGKNNTECIPSLTEHALQRSYEVETESIPLALYGLYGTH